MKLRDHFQIFRRAAKFTFSTNRKYTVLLIVNTVLSSIIGYVPIYFSAKVIDSLVAKSSIETVILYVALTAVSYTHLDVYKRQSSYSPTIS